MRVQTHVKFIGFASIARDNDMFLIFPKCKVNNRIIISKIPMRVKRVEDIKVDSNAVIEYDEDNIDNFIILDFYNNKSYYTKIAIFVAVTVVLCIAYFIFRSSNNALPNLPVPITPSIRNLLI